MESYGPMPLVEGADVATVSGALGRPKSRMACSLLFVGPIGYSLMGCGFLSHHGPMFFLGWFYVVLGAAMAVLMLFLGRRWQVEKLPPGTYTTIDDAGSPSPNSSAGSSKSVRSPA